MSKRWYVADGCSWRRILEVDTDDPVIVPTNHPVDRHPDLAGDRGNLELAARAPELLDEVDRLTAENERLRRDYAQLKAMYLELSDGIDELAEQLNETQ